MKRILNKKNGVTLIEALMVVSVGAVATTTTLQIMKDSEESTQVNLLSKQLNTIVEGFDQRLTIDRYNANLWPDIDSIKDYNTRAQVSDFLSKTLIAHNASGCGNQTEGWRPTIEDSIADGVSPSVSDDYRNQLKLIPCGLWSNHIPFRMESSLHLKTSGSQIDKIYTLLFFENDSQFEKNFLSAKQALLKSKSSSLGGEGGTHEFKMVDLEASDISDSNLSTIECLNKGTKCAFYAGIETTGEGLEYLHVDGSNSMVNSKLKFKKDLASANVNTCSSYNYDVSNGTWSYMDNYDCGIGINPDKSINGLPFVEVNVDTATIKRIYLDKECELKDGSTQPCGLYNNPRNGDQVLMATEFLDSKFAEIEVMNVTNATIENLNVLSQLVSNIATINTLTVNGVSTFTGDANFNGLNNTVNKNLTVKEHTELELLTVNDQATFKKDILAEKDIDVKGTLTANNYKLGTISSSDLGRNCDIQNSLKLFVDGDHSELAVCANSGSGVYKWKLANARENQIIAFKGSCPEGFEKFSEGEGRFLVGASNSAVETNGVIDLDANGNAVTYQVGDVGGHSFVALTEAEMPSHKHAVPTIETTCSGSDCQGSANLKSGNDTVWSYTRELNTGSAGNDLPHENRPAYYAVNYCIFKEL